MNIQLAPLDEIGVFFVVVLNAMRSSSLSMVLAAFLRTRDRMMGIGQAITMPLFFASNAIYPIILMPAWLQGVAIANPLSYVVDALRSLLLTGNYSQLPTDLLVTIAYTVVFLVAASVMIRRLLE